MYYKARALLTISSELNLQLRQAMATWDIRLSMAIGCQ